MARVVDARMNVELQWHRVRYAVLAYRTINSGNSGVLASSKTPDDVAGSCTWLTDAGFCRQAN